MEFQANSSSSNSLEIPTKHRENTAIRDSQTTLNLDQGQRLSQVILGNMVNRQLLVDNWVSLRLDLVYQTLQKITPVHDGSLLWKLLVSGVSAYPDTDFFARHHLRSIIYETFIYFNGIGYNLSAANHTDLVIFMSNLSSEMALGILKAVPQKHWSEHCHAISYHLGWTQASAQVVQAEQDIITAHTLLKKLTGGLEDANEQLKLDLPFKSPTQESTKNLQKNLKERHWLSLRQKFEQSWRGHIDLNIPPKGLKGVLREDAATLLGSILVIAFHFEEYEYCWYWSERSKLENEWPILVSMIRVCRTACAVGADKEIWKARASIFYKTVLEKKNEDISHSSFYSIFMAEV